MHRPRRNRHALVVTSMFVLLALAAGAAQAAPAHQVILELELEGAGCPGVTLTAPPLPPPVNLITISSQSCELDVLIDELEAELLREGLPGSAFCAAITGPTPTLDDFQCFWVIPAGCTQVRERLTLETGTMCAGDNLRGETQGPLPFIGNTFSTLTVALP